MFLDFYRSRDGRRVLGYQVLALAAGAIALTLGLGDGHVDLTVARWFFDDARRVFPLTNQWWLKEVLHDAARTVSAIGGLGLLGLTVASFTAPRLLAGRARREELLFASIAAFAAVAVVSALKHFSSHACPWDLDLFGGSAVHHSLLAAPAAATSVSGCFPAAHPLAGYAWLCVGFALYPSARKRAWAAWASACALGTLLGAVQMARGAHFLSHVLWSAWTVWAVNLAVLAAAQYSPARRRAARADTLKSIVPGFLSRQRIRPHLEVHDERLRALAAFLEPRRAIAARHPQPTALPSRVRVVDAAFEALRVEPEGIRDPQRHHLAVDERVHAVEQVRRRHRHVGTEA
jgi:membrane-associated PAP2 superfamily phosphatase